MARQCELLNGIESSNVPSEAGVETLASRLRTWLETRAGRLEAVEDQRQLWAELQSLLADETLAQLQERAEQARQAADQQLVPSPGSIELEPNIDAQRQGLESAAQGAQQAANRALGVVQERRRVVPDVAEAREALARAETEFRDLQRLDQTLEQTRSFLSEAQKSVHQDIARVLADGLREWLPRVTAGRYHEPAVDPETLQVQVHDAGGHARYAHLLSHGTAEQIYLLLRAVMARHLTKPGEVSPLLLDDVTVHCDQEREQAVLEVLHTLSEERQVILFTQEDSVLGWAKAHLASPRDSLVRLTADFAVT